MGRLVQLRVPVGAPVDRVDPSAYRLAAPFLSGHREGPQGDVQHLVVQRQAVVRCQATGAQGGEHIRGVELRLHHVEHGTCRMEGELRADRGADPLQPGEDRHLQRDRAHTVAERLQVVPAGFLLDLPDRERPVLARDVVDRELSARRGQVDARPVVEQPDVVAGPGQELREVLLDGRREERVGRHAEPRRQHDGALVAGLVPGQAQEGVAAEPVARMPVPVAVAPPGPVRVLGRPHRRRRRRRAGERAGLVEDTAVDAHDLVGEQLQERTAVLALLLPRDAGDLDGADHPGEVKRLQAQYPLARFRAALFADRRVQRRRLGPGVASPATGADLLVAFEAVPFPLLRQQGHPVAHVPGLYPRQVGIEEREAAFGHGQRVR